MRYFEILRDRRGLHENRTKIAQNEKFKDKNVNIVHVRHSYDTLLSMANLAGTYFIQGRLDEAEALEVLVLERRKQILGDRHPDTLVSTRNLAFTYRNQGYLDKAKTLEEERDNEPWSGDDPSKTSPTSSNLQTREKKPRNLKWWSWRRGRDCWEKIKLL